MKTKLTLLHHALTVLFAGPVSKGAQPSRPTLAAIGLDGHVHPIGLRSINYENRMGNPHFFMNSGTVQGFFYITGRAGFSAILTAKGMKKLFHRPTGTQRFKNSVECEKLRTIHTKHL